MRRKCLTALGIAIMLSSLVLGGYSATTGNWYVVALDTACFGVATICLAFLSIRAGQEVRRQSRLDALVALNDLGLVITSWESDSQAVTHGFQAVMHGLEDTEGALVFWGRTLEELLETARENLAAYPDGMAPGFSKEPREDNKLHDWNGEGTVMGTMAANRAPGSYGANGK